MKTIAGKNTQDSHVSTGATPVPHDGATRAPNGTSEVREQRSDFEGSPPTSDLRPPPVSAPTVHRYRKWLLLAGVAAALCVGGYFLVPWVNTALNTVSTDDAYVNGHVTLVAPRVPGQVMKVLVDDNQRVKKGDLLVQLDKEPYQVQLALKRAAVQVAEANLAAAEAAARGLGALLSAQRWKLQNASEQVDAQIALLRSQAAALRSQEAVLDKARADFNRATALLPEHAVSRSDYDQYEQQLRVATASLTQAQEAIAQTRVSLGLAPQPEKGKGLSDVPPDLDQTFSSVRGALAACMATATQLGLPLASTDLTPNKAIEQFRQLDKKGDIDQILQDLVPKMPAVLQAKAGLEAARHDLEQAELNLRYCDIVSEIDGVVVGRKFDGKNLLYVLNNLPHLERGVHPHRNVVFLPARCRHAVHAGRMRQHFAFIQERSRSDVRHHITRRQAGLARQKRRQSLVDVRVDKTVDPALTNAGEIGQRDGCVVEAIGERRTVEVAAGEYVTARCEDEWVVGCGACFNLYNRRHVVERVANRAMHLRHTAQAVSVLNSRIVSPVRLPNLAAVEQYRQMPGRGCLSSMRSCLLDPGIEGRRSATQRL